MPNKKRHRSRLEWPLPPPPNRPERNTSELFTDPCGRRTAARRLRQALPEPNRLVGIAFLRDASDKNAMGKFNRHEAEQQRIFHRAMMDLERLYEKWKNEQPQVIEEPAEPVNETNPFPEPAVENKADNCEAPTPEPKIAAETSEAPGEAQGFSPGLTKETNEKEANPSAGPQNPNPLLPKAA